MAAKRFQALKFTEGLENDLKTLAGMKNIGYNPYIEAVLSQHVLLQKKLIRKMAEEDRKNGEGDEVVVEPKSSDDFL